MKEALVWLLAGSETTLKDDFLNNLKASVFNNKPSAVDYDFFHAQEVTQLSSVINSAYTQPLIFSKRLIVIKNIEQLKEADKELLLKYTNQPSLNSILVLDTSLNDLRGEFWQKLSQKAKVSYFKPKQGREVSDWILEEAKKEGKTISLSAAMLLENKIGPDLTRLKKTIEQLGLYAYPKKEITKEDVELLAGKDYLSGTFDLLRALNKREVAKAIEILNELWSENKSAPEILGLLAWHFRRLLKVKELMQSKISKQEAASQLNIKSNYQMEMILKDTQAFTISRLKQIFKLLAQADLSLRGHRSLEKNILEFLLIKICQGEKNI